MDGIILVNKPSGITSHDAVLKVRRALHIDKIGHTGTLDPLASGLMIMTVGKATKILPFLSHHKKEYICTVKFGLRSDTLDSEGEILEQKAINHFTEKEAVEALNSFLGKSQQIPPMYSAKKVNGVPLYKMARNDKEIERKPIDIEISEIELLDLKEDEMTYRAIVSTGTYIRTLSQDIAEKLDNICIMTALKRTQIDRFSLDQADSIESFNEGNYHLYDIYDVLSDYPYIEYQDINDVYNGKRIKLDCNDETVMITDKGKVVAAYYYNAEDGYYYCKRGLM